MTYGDQLLSDASWDLLAVLKRLEIVQRGPVVCVACGCLCRPLETCPSCHPETVRT